MMLIDDVSGQLKKERNKWGGEGGEGTEDLTDLINRVDAYVDEETVKFED